MNKLERLDLMLADFPNWQSVQNYFIGILSTEVPDEVWDKCLEYAKSCAVRQGERQAREEKIYTSSELNFFSEENRKVEHERLVAAIRPGIEQAIEQLTAEQVCYWCKGPWHPKGEVCKQAPYYVES